MTWASFERQIGNLVDAIADGEDAPRLRGAIKDREHRAAQLRTQLASLEKLDRVSALDTGALTSDLEALLTDWRDWIGGHPQQARQILHKLVVGRLTFTPRMEEGVPFYEFTGTGALEPILARILPPVRNNGAPGVTPAPHTV